MPGNATAGPALAMEKVAVLGAVAAQFPCSSVMHGPSALTAGALRATRRPTRSDPRTVLMLRHVMANLPNACCFLRHVLHAAWIQLREREGGRLRLNERFTTADPCQVGVCGTVVMVPTAPRGVA